MASNKNWRKNIKLLKIAAYMAAAAVIVPLCTGAADPGSVYEKAPGEEYDDAAKGDAETKEGVPGIEVIMPQERTEPANKKENVFYFNEKNRDEQTLKIDIYDEDTDPERTYVRYVTEENGIETEHTDSFSDPEAGRVIDEENAQDGIFSYELQLRENMLYRDIIIHAEDKEGNIAEDYSVSGFVYIVDTERPVLKIRMTEEMADDGTGTVTFSAFVSDRNLEISDEGYERADYVLGSGMHEGAWTVTDKYENEDRMIRIDQDTEVLYSEKIQAAGDEQETMFFDLAVTDLAGNTPEKLVAEDEDEQTVDVRYSFEYSREEGRLTGSITAGRASQPQISDAVPPLISMAEESRPAAYVENPYGEMVALYTGSAYYSLAVSDRGGYDGDGTEAVSGLETVRWSVAAEGVTTVNGYGSYDDLGGIRSGRFEIPVIAEGTAETNDIELTVTAYDTAGNESTYVKKLAIDNRPPRAELIYDNNSAKNGKYFNAPRNLSIRIEDLNPDPDMMKVKTQGEFSGWRTGENGGHSLTGSVSFDQEGDYTFEMTACDAAGNAAGIDYGGRGTNASPREFTVDTTAPSAEITGVENGRAYTQDAAPAVHLRDRNIDPDGCSVTWQVTRIGERIGLTDRLRTECKKDELIYTFEDMPKVRSKDGIYMISVSAQDLAGNTFSPGRYLYSLNRFGSVFTAYDDETLRLLKSVYTKKAPTLQILETNPDRLSGGSIIVSVNGRSRRLTEGEDYRIKKNENEDEWKQYVYTVYDSAFTDEKGTAVQGDYLVSIYSEDEAGNSNSNRDNAGGRLDIEYTIDREAPSGFIDVKGLKEGSDELCGEEAEVTVHWDDNTGIGNVQIYLNKEKLISIPKDRAEALNGRYVFRIGKTEKKQSVYALLNDRAGNTALLDEVSFYFSEDPGGSGLSAGDNKRAGTHRESAPGADGSERVKAAGYNMSGRPKTGTAAVITLSAAAALAAALIIPAGGRKRRH